MHYLQMALEKSAKAHFWMTDGSGTDESRINTQHQVIARILPRVYEEYWRRQNGRRTMPRRIRQATRHLCREIDFLSPSAVGKEQRPDNCEYPWTLTDESNLTIGIQSPLDHHFSPTDLLRNPASAGFLKAIRTMVKDVIASDSSKTPTPTER